ncbi:MAG TPA: hypothetical protein VF796_05220 [Humisphaera sp.]
MAQAQTNAARFAGPDMIHDADHNSGIVPVQDATQGSRQSQQGSADRRQKASKEQGAGDFEYHNPRQYS